MIERKDLESALEGTRGDGVSTSLYFILRSGPKKSRPADAPPFEVLRARMTQEIADEFRTTLTGWLERLLSNEDLSFIDFDPFSTAERNKVERQDAAGVPGLPEMLERMDAPNKINFANLSGREFFNSLWAYAVFVHAAQGRAAYFRKFSPSKVIEGGGALKAIVDGGALRKIESSIFNFDEQADALVIGDEVLILQKTLFEQIFELTERIYGPQAQKALEKLADSGLLSDWKALEEACEGDDGKLKKLADIDKNIPLELITFEKLEAVQRDWGVDVKLDPNSRQIIVDKKRSWNILKLIDDDHLSSPMTRVRYEVQSKRKVKPRPGSAATRSARKRASSK
jgi:hypothetical protein